MKTQEYFNKKINALRNELYSEISELASKYKENDKGRFIYPHDTEEIAFFNDSSDKFENHKIKDILIDKIRVCIYPESSDFLPYELSDIINIHDLMILRSIIAFDRPRNELYLEVKELASVFKGDDKPDYIYAHNDEAVIQFLNISSDKFENHKIRDILIGEDGVYIYPESREFNPCHLSGITNVHDLMVLKSLIDKK